MTTITLQDKFDDVETAAADLTYEVLSNSNSGLFDDVSIDSLTDVLSLDYAQDQNGFAEIVIRATDAGGLHTDVTLNVSVAADNDAPVITNFSYYFGAGDLVTFSGHVDDVDDNPAGWTVTFDGILANETATVDANGNFVLTVLLPPGSWGVALAWVFDGQGLQSNVGSVLVEYPEF